MKNVKTLIALFAIAFLAGCQSTGSQHPVAEVTNQPSPAEVATAYYVNFFNKKDTEKATAVRKTCNVMEMTTQTLKQKAIIADGAEEKCFEAFLAYAKLFKTSPEPIAFVEMEKEVRAFIAPKSMMQKASDTTKSGLETAGEYTKKGADFVVESGKKLFNNVKSLFSSDEEEKTAEAKQPAPVKTL